MRPSDLLGEYYNAEFFKAHGPQIYTIQSYSAGEFKARDGSNKVERRWVLDVGEPKKLVLNTENCKAVIELFGDDFDAWLNQSIEVYYDPKVKFGGKPVGGLRIRAPQDVGF